MIRCGIDYTGVRIVGTGLQRVPTVFRGGVEFRLHIVGVESLGEGGVLIYRYLQDHVFLEVALHLLS